jgi:hypothetical protein
MTSYLEYRRALKLGQLQPEKKPRKKIPKVSKKRAVINQEYAKISRPIWVGKPCAARTPVCTGRAQGIHHPEGKETTEKLLDPDNMMACCNPCNSWIEANDAKAREMGLKRSRLNKK